MRFILIIILLLRLGYIGQSQAISVVETGVPYDTILLKNNCRLIYSKTYDLRIIRFIGPTIDTILKADSIFVPEKTVGWLGADFDHYFAWYYTYSGFYDLMHIFKKENGKRIASGIVIAIDTLNEAIYFEDFNKRNLLTLFDFKKGAIEQFIPPKTPCLHWYFCIKKLLITEKTLTMTYTGNNGIQLQKIYVR
jgi:hypothetical protein